MALVAPSDIVSAANRDPRADKLIEGMSTGAGSVGIGGMLAGAAVCGPYLYGLCVIGLGAAGMIAGAAGGTVYGFTGLSDSAADSLAEQVELVDLRIDIQASLVASVERLVPTEMLATPETAAVQAILVIESMEFKKSRGAIYLETSVRLSYSATESRRVPELGSRVFTGLTRAEKLDYWLEPGSQALEVALTNSLGDIAEDIAAVMLEHWSP